MVVLPADAFASSPKLDMSDLTSWYISVCFSVMAVGVRLLLLKFLAFMYESQSGCHGGNLLAL
jgi:hypothetical protein